MVEGENEKVENSSDNRQTTKDQPKTKKMSESQTKAENQKKLKIQKFKIETKKCLNVRQKLGT